MPLCAHLCAALLWFWVASPVEMVLMTHFDLPMYVTAQLSFNRGVSSVTVRKSDSSESPQSVITRPY